MPSSLAPVRTTFTFGNPPRSLNTTAATESPSEMNADGKGGLPSAAKERGDGGSLFGD
ncbi:UNVERIFIED_ORG: hypothetical protein J2W66_002907 [Agrobacterium larrymoorei]|nr:hypothetical protein [Agrobacterium larrymoorei]